MLSIRLDSLFIDLDNQFFARPRKLLLLGLNTSFFVLPLFQTISTSPSSMSQAHQMTRKKNQIISNSSFRFEPSGGISNLLDLPLSISQPVQPYLSTKTKRRIP